MSEFDDDYQPPRMKSDSQQWEFDLAIQQTGRVQHFFESRKLPNAIKTYAMVSKHLAKPAIRAEKIAAIEEAAGHLETALEFYFDASEGYSRAQHALFSNSMEKRRLHAGCLRNFEQVRRLSPTPVERIEIPWNGVTLAGYLHLAPVDGPAPLVFFIPGIDMTKEVVPVPGQNWALNRGMHLFVIDGPGQGECNLNDIPLTVDNYEDACRTALTHLLERPDIDHERVGLFAMSFGSYWGVRVAATDDRYKAAVLQWASMTDPYYLFEGFASPRYKQVLAYVTRSGSEEEVDDFLSRMKVDSMVPDISMPTLTTVGEFDQRSPLDEVYRFFDALTTPGELWVFADQHHQVSVRGKSSAMSTSHDSHAFAMDWLRDRMQDKPLAHPGEVVYLDVGGLGPNDPSVKTKRHWLD